MAASAPWRRLLVLVTIALVYWRAVTVFYIVDDFTFLAQAGAPPMAPGLSAFFAERYLSAQVLFRLGRSLFGVSPGPFHLLTIGLHCLNAWLVFLVATRLTGERRAALWASLLFAVHPVAYTPVVWLAAGFNELPVLGLALASTWVLLADSERPRAWTPLVMAGCVVLAAGFKQHAVLIPLYWLTVVASRAMSERPWPGRAVFVATAASLLLVPFYVFFAMAVLPRMRVLFAGPYERVLEPTSLGRTLAHLAVAALNPLPILRESLSTLVPGAGVSLSTPAAVAVAIVLAGGLTAIAWRHAAASARGWLAVSPLLLVALLALPAAMPRHVHEYYAYLSLPIPALLWALALRLPGRPAVAGRPWARRALAVICAAALWAHGAVLHARNDAVAQAGRARAIDQAVSAVADGERVFVLPPSDAAWVDTVFGGSIAALHSHRGVTVAFADRPAAPTIFRSTPPWRLLSADPRGHGVRVALVDEAQWREVAPPLTLDIGSPDVEQDFASSAGFRAVLVKAEFLGRDGCRLEYVLRDTRSRVVWAEGVVACRDLAASGFTPLATPRAERAGAGSWRLTLRRRGDTGVVRLAMGPPLPGGPALRLAGAPLQTALAYRVERALLTSAAP